MPGNGEGPAGRVAAPRTAYERRLAERKDVLARAARADRRIADLRLTAALVALIVGVLGALTDALHPAWALVPAGAFVALVAAHDRWRRRAARLRSAVRLYEQGLARLEERWAGTGQQGAGFFDPTHAYAADLDLFGPGSLFELLCTARTRAGASTLARWLKAPADAATARARQAAVRELAPRLDLREQLALEGERIEDAVHPERIARWATAEPAALPSRLRVVGATLTVVTGATLAAWAFSGVGPLPFAVALLVHVAVLFAVRAPVQRVISGAEAIETELPLLAGIMRRLEAEPAESAALVALQARLDRDGVPASARLARLARLIGLLEQRRNQFFAPVAALLCWGSQLTVSIERWRARHGAEVEGWLDAVGELEALGALAGYAFEHPDDPFPDIVDDGPIVEARGIGHPLLPAAASVRNDVSLGGERRMLLVSGSNMSGKSTLLRTVGTNVVLALAGAPVRARELRVSPLDVGAVIVIHDSLQEGTSRFMAEIERIRAVVERARSGRPLLFLMDELLAGTNSRDRRAGAEALLGALLDAGAIGLVTTHDLALAEIAEALAPATANVHFEDRLERGRLVFDYRLRDGVVTKSNALDLMRSIGLDV